MEGLNRNLTPFKHAVSVYERMLQIAEEHKRVRYGSLGFDPQDDPDPEFYLDPDDLESGKAVPFFSGSMSTIIRDVTNNRGQYSVIREILTQLRCIQLTSGGGRGSEYYLLRHPDETEGGEAPAHYSTNRAGSKYSDTRQGQIRNDLDILRAMFHEQQKQLEQVTHTVLELAKWTQKIEDRLYGAESRIENLLDGVGVTRKPSAFDLIEGGENDGQEIHAEEGAETESGTA